MSVLNLARELFAERRQSKYGTITRRDHLITMLLGTWLMIGLFLDGWAHNNLGAALETFFTPWHGVFYSGFLATAGWMSWLVFRNLRAGRAGVDAFPRGYGLGLLGVVLFGLGGMGDMLWHTILGIEVGVEALLSPTHLLIFVGGLLVMTSPVRAYWSSTELDGAEGPTFAAMLPVLFSITITAAFIIFMNQHLWMFDETLPFRSMQHYWDHYYTGEAAWRARSMGDMAGFGMFLVTIVLLVAPLLYLLRRWRLPVGSASFLLGMIGICMMMMAGLDTPLIALVPTLGAGVVGDLLLAWLRPGPDRPGAVKLFAVALPVIIGTCYFLTGYFSHGGFLWSVELWAGMVTMGGIAGLGLAVIMAPVPVRGE